jgi:hypothetical protein
MSTCAHRWLNFETEMHCLDELEVVVRSEGVDALSLRFAERHVSAEPRDGRLFFLVQAQAPGLEARLEGMTNFVSGTGLADFVDGLDLRGWEGEREWHNADRDLLVSATWQPRGYVDLKWTLRPWRASVTGGWAATLSTSLAVGADKDALAADLREFLTVEGTR